MRDRRQLFWTVLALLVWPVRLSLYGTDVFRSGGADGDGDVVFDLIVAGAVAWSIILLAIGNRAVHSWSWPRAAAATALPAVVPALAYAAFAGLV